MLDSNLVRIYIEHAVKHVFAARLEYAAGDNEQTLMHMQEAKADLNYAMKRLREEMGDE